MNFKQPLLVYTAETNLEAHVIVEMLAANGIPAIAVEDQSGVSLWEFGTLSQFHKPNIWVDACKAEAATRCLQTFEETKRNRYRPRLPDPEANPIFVTCEDCGQVTDFPQSLNGSTQECSHCQAYVDVGELPWEDDFGDPEE